MVLRYLASTTQLVQEVVNAKGIGYLNVIMSLIFTNASDVYRGQGCYC